MFANAALGLTYSFMITMIFLSEMMWPGEPFHIVEMGSIITVRWWALAISGIIVGRIVDRHQRKIQLVISIALAGLAYFSVGFMPARAGVVSFLGFFILYGLAGIGNGGFMPAILSYTNDFLNPPTRSQFFGKFNLMSQGGEICGLVLAAVFVQAELWRQFYWIIGGLLLLASIVIFFKIPEPKRGAKYAELKEVLENVKVHYHYSLTRETARSTILKPTNIIAFMEGLFTCILLTTTQFLVLPYLQAPPYNVAETSTAIFIITFGLPGALAGSLAFARISDKLGGKDIKHRLTLIAISIVLITVGQISLFLVPFPTQTPEQGNDLGYFIVFPEVWVLGGIMMMISAFQGIYSINQPPVLQAINLPEAQGIITGWNQFLETIGKGAAPLIAAAFLTSTGNNYLITAIFCGIFGLPGGFMWWYARKTIHGDITFINSILKTRTAEMKHQIKEK